MYRVIWRRKRPILILACCLSFCIAAAGFLSPSGNQLLLALAYGLGVATLAFAAATLLVERTLALWRAPEAQFAEERCALLDQVSRLNASLAASKAETAKALEEIKKRSNKASSKAPGSPIRQLDGENDYLLGEALLDRALVNIAAIAPAIAPGRRRPAHYAIEPSPGAPMVTVVIPMFNESRFVAATIESVRHQTLQDFEALIVDDASIDDSMTAALDAAKGDERFRFVRHAANAGLSAARNTGLRLARAPLIAFLDSDDLFFPDALEVKRAAIVNLIRNDDSDSGRVVAGVYCRNVTMPQNITLDEAAARISKRDVTCGIIDFVNSSGECPFNAHAPMLFTKIVCDHGGFDETLRFGCEDWDLWQRIMRNGFAFAPTRRISGVYRRKRGSMVKETPHEHLDAAKMLFARARRPIDPQHVVSEAPFVFEREIHYYQGEVRFMSRIAQYAIMNAFASPRAYASTVKSAPVGLAACIDVETDLRPVVEAGIRRATALDDGSIERLSSKFEALAAGVIDQLRTRIALPPPRTIDVPPALDVLFLPQTQAQVRAMVPAANALIGRGHSVAFVTTEAETGDQGQRAAVAAAGVPSLTFNSACLKKIHARTFVIMRPYSAVIRDAIPSGAAIIEIERADRPVSAPDENVPRTDVTHASPDRAADVLADLIAKAHPAEIGEAAHSPDGGGFESAPVIIAMEESFHQTPDYERLAALKDKWRGERCVIIGNGPSINQTDLTKLRDEHTFAVNGIFYKASEMGFDPTFYVVEDSAVMKENIEAIKSYKGRYKLFPTLYRNLHPKGDNVFFFLMNRGFYERESPSFCIPRFSTDAARRVYCGQSVTHINLQLAYYFGFSEVYLIGVDFSYVIPESAIRKGDLITSTEDDPNHFHGDYFGKGKTWKDPKLHRVALNYELARDMFEADGRKVYNATKGGKLEVFERADYDCTFDRPGRSSSRA